MILGSYETYITSSGLVYCMQSPRRVVGQGGLDGYDIIGVLAERKVSHHGDDLPEIRCIFTSERELSSFSDGLPAIRTKWYMDKFAKTTDAHKNTSTFLIDELSRLATEINSAIILYPDNWTNSRLGAIQNLVSPTRYANWHDDNRLPFKLMRLDTNTLCEMPLFLNGRVKLLYLHTIFEDDAVYVIPCIDFTPTGFEIRVAGGLVAREFVNDNKPESEKWHCMQSINSVVELIRYETPDLYNSIEPKTNFEYEPLGNVFPDFMVSIDGVKTYVEITSFGNRRPTFQKEGKPISVDKFLQGDQVAVSNVLKPRNHAEDIVSLKETIRTKSLKKIPAGTYYMLIINDMFQNEHVDYCKISRFVEDMSFNFVFVTNTIHGTIRLKMPPQYKIRGSQEVEQA